MPKTPEEALILLQDEAQELVNERAALLNRIREVETRLTQIVGGMQAVKSLME